MDSNAKIFFASLPEEQNTAREDVNGKASMSVIEKYRMAKSYLYIKKHKRFFAKVSESKLHALIESAPFYYDLERIAYDYDLCDICNLEGINIYPLKRAFKTVVSMLYKYPRLRAGLNYFGTEDGYNNMLQRVKDSNSETLHALGIDCKEIKDIIIRDIDGYFVNDTKSEVIAMAIQSCSVFDGILLVKSRFEGYKFITTDRDIKSSVKKKFFPKECDKIEAITAHEVGHLLDYLCNLSDSEELLSIWRQLNKFEKKIYLSQYSSTSPQEFVAEGFSEYVCSSEPRQVARIIGRLLEEKMKNIK